MGVVSALGGPMSSAGVSQSQLQAELARKEAALAAMFESGRSMPKASQVAQMRAEISALMDQLAGRPVQPLMPPGAATDPRTGGASTSGPRGGASAAAAAAAAANGPSKGVGIAMAAIAAGGSTGAPRSRADELAFRAYDRVEQQLRNNQALGGGGDDMEMARLEAENISLRALAYSLLKRQQQLETLQAEVQGEKEPELLLETTSALLSRMKDKLSKAAAATAAEPGAAANGAPQGGLGDAATGGPVAEAASAPAPLPATPENSIARAFMVADQAKPAAAAAVGAAA